MSDPSTRVQKVTGKEEGGKAVSTLSKIDVPCPFYSEIQIICRILLPIGAQAARYDFESKARCLC